MVNAVKHESELVAHHSTLLCNQIRYDKLSHLFRIQYGGLCDETLHAPHAAVHHVDGDLSHLGVAVRFSEGLDLFLRRGDLRLEDGLEVGGGVAAGGGDCRRHIAEAL